MVYPVLCILPRGRHMCVTNSAARAVEEGDIIDCEEDSRCINVTDENGDTQLLTYNEVGLKFGFEYSSRLQFLHETDFRGAPFYAVDVDNREDDIFITGIASIEEDITKGKISDKMSIRHIGVLNGVDVGYGAFADAAIPSGALIGEYVGIMSTTSSPTQYSLSYPSCTGGHEINALSLGNMIRFLNHSADPNASFRVLIHEQIPHVVCIASRQIEAKEQITVSYGAAFWHYHEGADNAKEIAL